MPKATKRKKRSARQKPVTLEELGIDPEYAARCMAIASIQDDVKEA